MRRRSDRGRQSRVLYLCLRGVVHIEAINNWQNKIMKFINIIVDPTIRISGSSAYHCRFKPRFLPKIQKSGPSRSPCCLCDPPIQALNHVFASHDTWCDRYVTGGHLISVLLNSYSSTNNFMGPKICEAGAILALLFFFSFLFFFCSDMCQEGFESSANFVQSVICQSVKQQACSLAGFSLASLLSKACEVLFVCQQLQSLSQCDTVRL